jgi:hypothetical protein
MTKIISSRLVWGLVLIVGGVLLLLDTLGIFKGGALFWTIVTALAGVLFLSVYVTNRVHWWALIPGIIFLALAAIIGLTSFLPGFTATNYAGTIILGGIGLSFLMVYLAERKNWWALIPFGVMATLAVVATFDQLVSGTTSGGIFFLGLGVTFALVAILPPSVGQMRWAWIPAAILGLFGIILVIASESYLNNIWPIVLVLGGFVLIVRSMVRKG